jgi:hypothetical protein
VRSTSLEGRRRDAKEASLGRQSAHYILGPFGSDSDLRRLRRHGEKIASRGAKNAKKRAVVAVARKLFCATLHRLWVTGEVYEPLHTIRIAQETRRRQLKERGDGADQHRGGEDYWHSGDDPKARGTEHGFFCPTSRLGSKEVTAQLRTWSTLKQEKRPIRRLQRLISSPDQDGSHPMHRATTKKSVSSLRVRIEA